MAIIPRGAGGSGGGSSVTISTATPQPLGTAAAGSTGEASDAGHVHDRELPDPTGAPDGQVVTTAGGALVLATPSGGGPSRVAFDLSSATGWTVVAGTGSAAIDTGAETADLGIPSATVCLGDNTPTISYPLAAPEEWEVRARLAELSGGAGGSPRAVLDVASAASGETGVSLVSVWVDASGNVELLTFLAGSGSSRGTISASLPRGGTGWVRVRRRDGLVSVYHGTGVGTAPPTVWRCSHSVSWAAASPTVALGHVRARALHFGAASSTPVVVSWADISEVDMGAPL